MLDSPLRLLVLLGLIACAAPQRRFLMGWAVTLPIYFMLGTAAAYKALWEITVVPFYWDKTGHGKSAAPATPDGCNGALRAPAAVIHAATPAGLPPRPANGPYRSRRRTPGQPRIRQAHHHWPLANLWRKPIFG